MIGRAITILRRRRAARRLGLKFTRSSTFALPATLAWGRQTVSLHAPRDAGTASAFIDVFLDDCYRLTAVRPPPKTILDIGAHVGFFSLAARERFGSARIHAYEPNPQIVPDLRANAAPAGVTVFAEAVGAHEGTVRLEVSAQSVLTRIGAGGLEVRQTGFGEALRRLGGDADLVKLDCEGAEWEILAAAEPWARVRALTMEYHLWAGYSFAELVAAIERTGLRVKKFDPPTKDFGMLFAER